MTSKHIYSTTNLSDLQLKEQGNRLFASRKYDDAIICYSKAIVSSILFIIKNHTKALSIL